MEIIRTVVDSDLKYIKKFRDSFINLLLKKNYESEMIFKLKLILDELTANSYKHGNRKDINKKIEIIIMFFDTFLFIKVKDEGKGILRNDYCDRFAENGRGMYLVEKLSDKMLVSQNTVACLVEN